LRQSHYLLNNYGQNDGIEDNELEKYFDLFKNKKYCLLIGRGRLFWKEFFEDKKSPRKKKRDGGFRDFKIGQIFVKV